MGGTLQNPADCAVQRVVDVSVASLNTSARTNRSDKHNDNETSTSAKQEAIPYSRVCDEDISTDKGPTGFSSHVALQLIDYIIHCPGSLPSDTLYRICQNLTTQRPSSGNPDWKQLQWGNSARRFFQSWTPEVVVATASYHNSLLSVRDDRLRWIGGQLKCLAKSSSIKGSDRWLFGQEGSTPLSMFRLYCIVLESSTSWMEAVRHLRSLHSIRPHLKNEIRHLASCGDGFLAQLSKLVLPISLVKYLVSLFVACPQKMNFATEFFALFNSCGQAAHLKETQGGNMIESTHKLFGSYNLASRDYQNMVVEILHPQQAHASKNNVSPSILDVLVSPYYCISDLYRKKDNTSSGDGFEKVSQDASTQEARLGLISMEQALQRHTFSRMVLLHACGGLFSDSALNSDAEEDFTRLRYSRASRQSALKTRSTHNSQLLNKNVPRRLPPPSVVSAYLLTSLQIGSCQQAYRWLRSYFTFSQSNTAWLHWTDDTYAVTLRVLCVLKKPIPAWRLYFQIMQHTQVRTHQALFDQDGSLENDPQEATFNSHTHSHFSDSRIASCPFALSTEVTLLSICKSFRDIMKVIHAVQYRDKANRTPRELKRVFSHRVVENQEHKETVAGETNADFRESCFPRAVEWESSAIPSRVRVLRAATWSLFRFGLYKEAGYTLCSEKDWALRSDYVSASTAARSCTTENEGSRNECLSRIGKDVIIGQRVLTLLAKKIYKQILKVGHTAENTGTKTDTSTSCSQSSLGCGTFFSTDECASTLSRHFTLKRSRCGTEAVRAFSTPQMLQFLEENYEV